MGYFMVILKRDVTALPVTWLGWLLYYLKPFKKSTAQQNIARVFQYSLTAWEKKLLSVAYYSHVITSIKEMISYAFTSKQRLAEGINIIGIEHLNKALQSDKGVLVMTGHLGSWEFAPLFSFVKTDGYAERFYCIRKSLRFAFLDKIFIRRFSDVGFKIINQANAIRQAGKALQKKRYCFFSF